MERTEAIVRLCEALVSSEKDRALRQFIKKQIKSLEVSETDKVYARMEDLEGQLRTLQNKINLG